jgi:hypothetical protein
MRIATEPGIPRTKKSTMGTPGAFRASKMKRAWELKGACFSQRDALQAREQYSESVLKRQER